VDLTEPFYQLKQQIAKLRASKFFNLRFIGFSTLALSGLVGYWADAPAQVYAALYPEKKVMLGAFPVRTPTVKYGFALDTFQVKEGKIRAGQFLSDLLLAQHVDYPTIEKIVKSARGIFHVNELRPGNAYTVLTKDSTACADHLIYEPNIYEYVIFNLKNELNVERVKRPTSTEVKVAAGKIEGSLWQAMTEAGMSHELADKMEDALQWSVDFHHIQKGDAFKLVYDQHFVEGKDAGIGRVHAAYYKKEKKEHYAIYFEGKNYKGYYDLNGRPMRNAFLKAPLRFSRISSYYNLQRFHPILRRVRPHFGTDYAAPHGTPILSVGDGVVLQASYTGGNGNFVKIRHNGTYESQYLHMSRFARGIRKGSRVTQGQVIGYVGSTGLATGPHVCFRFWMKGRQVNHLKLNLPTPDPLPAAEMEAFKKIRDAYVGQLQNADLKQASNP
jgi:murein DD-endopeptidase MepM/ murein hydrolase activator NlpD